MTLILGVDVETTGLSWKTDQVIELGYMVWDWEKQQAVVIRDYLLNRGHTSLTPDITRITGLTADVLRDWGMAPQPVFTEFMEYAKKCDAIMAHNGKTFDFLFIEKELSLIGRSLSECPKLQKIDTLRDIPWTSATRNLNHLAAEHGFINPMKHRAISDVITMMLTVSKYPLDGILKNSSAKSFILKAEVSFDDKQQAKDLGYRWEKSGELFYSKSWIKEVKEHQIEEEKSKAQFKVTILEEVRN